MKNKNDLYFVTTNNEKYKELTQLFYKKEININLIQNKDYYYEIQDKKLETIASICAKNASKKLNNFVIVDDSGLFVNKLNGFPGCYSSYILSTIGNHGIIKLLNNIKDRSAYIKTVISSCEPNLNPLIFSGIVHGTISFKEKGHFGFGYDSIFQYHGKTFSELSLNEKNRISSRSIAIELFIKWYKHNKITK